MKQVVSPSFFVMVSSPLGDAAVIWKKNDGAVSVIEILLPGRYAVVIEVIQCRYPGVQKETHRTVKTLCEKIGDFLTGNAVTFSLDLLDMGQCDGFQRRVLEMLSRVPRGHVTSYGRLAARINAPRAARAVGTALARNPFPLVLPCHRVVKNTGHVGNFGGGVEMKQALLQREGIETCPCDKINATYFW